MRTNKLRTMLVYLCVCVQLLMVSATRAQSGRGTVSGRVMDTSGGVLQGAAIELDPAGLTRVSDAQGEFTFTGVAAGSTTTTYYFVGIAAHSATVGGKASGQVVTDVDAAVRVYGNGVVGTGA